MNKIQGHNNNFTINMEKKGFDYEFMKMEMKKFNNNIFILFFY